MDFSAYDSIIDCRSPAEFAEDHIPGALSAPVLDDAERAAVGTLYKASPFEAKKLGAALVAKNVARHVETIFSGKGRGWRPLVPPRTLGQRAQDAYKQYRTWYRRNVSPVLRPIKDAVRGKKRAA